MARGRRRTDTTGVGPAAGRLAVRSGTAGWAATERGARRVVAMLMAAFRAAGRTVAKRYVGRVSDGGMMCVERASDAHAGGRTNSPAEPQQRTTRANRGVTKHCDVNG